MAQFDVLRGHDHADHVLPYGYGCVPQDPLGGRAGAYVGEDARDYENVSAHARG